jgi:hypothetical protein
MLRNFQSLTFFGRATLEVGQGAIALLVHPVRQPVDHVLDDLEALVHGRGADLHRP